MKKAEIKVGGLYRAKVSGKLTTVRVDAIDSESRGYGFNTAAPRRYKVTNLATDRKTTFRSAAKFRCEVKHAAVVSGVAAETLYPGQVVIIKESNDATTHATTGEQRSGADAGVADQGGNRRNLPRPPGGQAVAAPAGPVVASEAGGSSTGRAVPLCMKCFAPVQLAADGYAYCVRCGARD